VAAVAVARSALLGRILPALIALAKEVRGRLLLHHVYGPGGPAPGGVHHGLTLR
jgi:hypothetical protein